MEDLIDYEEPKEGYKEGNGLLPNYGDTVSSPFRNLNVPSVCANTVDISLQNKDVRDARILIDSGCTDHMFNNSDYFVELREETGRLNIGEKGRSISIKGMGIINLYNENNELIKLKEVYYVPDLPCNLISLTCIWRAGLQIVHIDETFIFTKGEKTIFCGDIDGKLLKADLKLKKKIIIESYACIKHRRLGHVGPDDDCEDFTVGKMPRKNLLKEINKTNVPGEELNVDLAGPFSPVSIGGSKYYLCIVDTANNFTWVRPIKNRFNETEEFKNCLKIGKTQAVINNLKRIVSDGGGEFTGAEFQNIIKNNGLEHIKTTPHTPQNNGKVERMNRILLNRVRTIMIEGGLPKFSGEKL